jgi:hypothetical protein
MAVPQSLQSRRGRYSSRMTEQTAERSSSLVRLRLILFTQSPVHESPHLQIQSVDVGVVAVTRNER